MLTTRSFRGPARARDDLSSRRSYPPPSGETTRRALIDAAVLTGCAIFMFAHAATLPLVLWDESRNAVNALEMHLRGLGLVTTYGFQPDLWNTKPPLLIWLQALAMAAIGPGELAVRLPSMLAAMGTLALTLSFTRRLSGSSAAAALATGLLAASYGFFGEFGARTGDFDALLCLFTTAYLQVLFFALHLRRPGAPRLLLAGALIAAAVLTKGVMGLAPGAGLAAYLLLVGRGPRLLSAWKGYGLMALTCAGPPAAFLLLREQAAPGYLRAMEANDLGGRVGQALDGHAGPPWFYLETTFGLGFFSCGGVAPLSPTALAVARGRSRLGLLFCTCVAGVLLLGLGLSRTKINHYAAPAYPFIAVAAALAVHAAFAALRRASSDGRLSPGVLQGGRLALVALLLLTALHALRLSAGALARLEAQSQAAYGALFRSLRARGARAVAVVDGGEVALGGVATSGTAAGYAPRLRFYSLLAATHGLQVRRLAAAGLTALPDGALAASCDPALRGAVRALGRDLSQTPGCVAVRVARDGPPPQAQGQGQPQGR